MTMTPKKWSARPFFSTSARCQVRLWLVCVLVVWFLGSVSTSLAGLSLSLSPHGAEYRGTIDQDPPGHGHVTLQAYTGS